MTILNKLTSYYLECLSHDDEGGISVFAYDKYGNPDYVQLTELPQLSEQPNELFNNEPTRKLLYKIRRDKSRLTLYLGYPIRLRKIRSKKSSWEGFKVEPLFLFPVDYNPGARDSIPQVNPEPPRFNFAALKGLVEEGSGHLLEEVVLLTEALGMDNGFQNMPELDEICSRLQELRSEWNWQEDLMPPNLALEPAISDITTEGFYNRAILVVGERSQFTQGLETELSKLSKINGHDLKDTALGYWLGLSDSDQAEHDDIPPLEVVELNEEQRQAVMRGTVSPLTVITGPPGTGKSQVVTTLLVNAAWRNMRVLFASKNNKAVDVVETRTNGLSNRPILLRLGRSEFQSRLADHLSDLLATQNTGDDERKFQEAKDKYEQLIAKEKQVKAKLEKIVELRNQVDSLEQKVESHRDLFGKEFFAKYLDSTPESISEVAEKFQSALAACYRQNNSFITRLFWHVLKNSKLQELSNIARSTERPATELGLKTPSLEVSESNLQVWIQYGTELNARLKAANEIYTYAMALAELQSIESPEILARESLELARHIADCSQEVWASWLNLQPKRLSQADRKLLGEYASVLSMIVNANKSSQRLSAGIFRQYYQLFPKVSHLLPCWAVTSLSAHNKVPFEPGFFDLVVIDEASQCDIASALPLLYRAKRAVIIGDPKQLQHISSISEQQDMQLLAKYGLSDGFVSWAYSVNSLYSLAQSLCASEAIVNLRDHHRSHEDIINFSNKHFYKGNLRVATRYDKLKRLKDHLPAVRWKDVIGRVTRPASGGAFNDAEAKAVVDMLDDLVITKQYNGSVGVVTPFRAQANRIRDLVYQRSNLSTRLVSLEFLVDTVHKFQGDERDLMIFSPVVSKGISDGATRFLNRNGNLFNVAITRARSLLLVVGDRNAILNCDIGYLKDFATYVGSLNGAQAAVDYGKMDYGPDYPIVAHPESVSDWEKLLYRELYKQGIRTIPQYRVDQYALDLAIVVNEKKLDIEVDGEMYHRNWDGELCRRDQIRNRRLIELGWDVMRFWVYEIRDDLGGCIERILKWVELADLERGNAGIDISEDSDADINASSVNKHESAPTSLALCEYAQPQTCRDEVVEAARAITINKGENEFTVQEIVDYLMARGTTYSESTIRTHVTSRCCINSPKNHAVVYGDFERVSRGIYQLVN